MSQRNAAEQVHRIVMVMRCGLLVRAMLRKLEVLLVSWSKVREKFGEARYFLHVAEEVNGEATRGKCAASNVL